MREGAALLCAILKHEMGLYSVVVQAWMQEHERFDRNQAEFGSWEKP
jgi:hypothetical protein